ncbi:peptidoglycan binding domain-containing protein [Kitasatospora sp. NPDC101183]|uniref:peptidoglycan binding domain-containing protein n=1 Tax=Kitasatospora sp. NPDC101183 TaxID=3364100 RepID=UPI00382ACD95
MSSRESDNANPTPRRTGPDAYPSGTPPYGTPSGGSAAGAAQGAASGGEDDGPKTETTLTTRVRINIPGSRPIPPVVVRSTVKNEDAAPEEAPAAAEPGGPRHRSAPASPVLGVMEGEAGRAAAPPNLPPEWQIPPIPPATSESESTGAWFRPRQKKTQPGDAPAAVQAAAPTAPAAPGAQQARPAPAAEARPQAAPAAAHRPSPGGTGQARPGGRPVPAQAQGPGQAPRQAGAPATPYGAEAPVEDQGVYRSADPFAPADPFAARGPRPGRPQPGQGRPDGRQQPGGQGRPQGPAANAPNPEDTSVDGFEPIREDTPAPASIPGGAPHTADGRPQPGLFASAPTGTDPFGTQQQQRTPAPGQEAFAPQGAAPGALFPHPPGAAARPQPGLDPEATEAIPLPVPPGGPTPPPAAAAAPSPVPPPAPAPAPAKAEAPGKGKKKGGGGKKVVKLGVYAVVGVLFLGAAAYGTGLMLNQSDVPKGTVVLGTDIGGNSRDQAIHALDESIGKTGALPLKLKVGDQSVDLDPTAAGLSFDTTATVDGLAQHSYNPVDVIKSIKGGNKAVAPEVRVDRAKLKAALDTLAAGSGQGLQEGYVKFSDTGDPVVVPGKAGQSVDSANALDAVEQAYRDRAAGKPEQPVALALTAAQPKVSTQALQAAADGLGKQVTSGKIHVLAGAKTWDFGPKTASKVLTLVPDASGKIVPKWDLDALNGQLGGVFDKVKVKKNGQTAAITPQDVADAVASLFDKTGDKDRTFKFTVA